MITDVMGQCQQWKLHLSVYFHIGAHEYPVLDRRPGSNDLELDFRKVCAVSCARKTYQILPMLANAMFHGLHNFLYYTCRCRCFSILRFALLQHWPSSIFLYHALRPGTPAFINRVSCWYSYNILQFRTSFSLYKRTCQTSSIAYR